MYEFVIDKHRYTRAADFAKGRVERFADVK